MENRPPSVFVSSTMYDLGELRTGLQQFVDGLGWRAVLAERDSFSVDTSESTVENSLRNVRENSDIFVMVVGARYGSIDPDSDKSVTNLEFLEARARRVPIYVFVKADVLAQLQVWRDNPEADFSRVVDTARVFEFVDSFYGTGNLWTFPFSTAAEIVDKLRTQFAYLTRDALGVRQLAHGEDRLMRELDGEALMLALRRDEHWEAKLFATVVEAGLDRLVPMRREIEHGLTRPGATFVDLESLAPWALDRIHELERLGETADAIVTAYLAQAFGDDGVPGDPLEIAAAARRLVQVWEDSAQWTLSCRSVRVDSMARRFVEALSRSNANMLEEIWEFGHTINSLLEQAINEHTDDEDEVVDITLTLTADLDEFNEESARLREALNARRRR